MLLALSLSLPSLNGAEPPYWGTIFVSSEIVTASDPSCFESMEERGTGMRTMYDRRIPGWTRQQAFLFHAAYDDGLSLEVQANPEFEATSHEEGIKIRPDHRSTAHFLEKGCRYRLDSPRGHALWWR